MSSISGVSGSSDAWAAWGAKRAQHQTKMFNKADTDASGGVDATELTTLLQEVSDKTGVSVQDPQALFQQMDGNGDGSLSSEELAEGMKQVLPPPPSTMAFAQSRGNAGDDLFGKIDTNADGSLDQTELQTFTDMVKAETGQDMGDRFTELDTDGDGTLSAAEFEAVRPEQPAGATGPGMAQGPKGAGGPPPAGGASNNTSSTDPLDTNQDGVVSELERLAGALKTLSTSDTSGNEALSEVAKLAQQLYEQISTSWLTQANTIPGLDATA